METVSNLASAASKAIWGEGETANETLGQEPRSGATGDVSAGQPYDLGNETVGEEPRSGETGDVKVGEPFDKGNEDQDLPVNTTSAGLAASSTHGANKAATTPQPGTETVGLADANTAPSTSHAEDPANAAQDTSGSQGSSQSLAEPKSDDSAAGVQTSGLPAGIINDETAQSNDSTNIKSSGVAAAGGDLDASKPGAGSEASRLLSDSQGTATGKTTNVNSAADADTNKSSSGGKLSHLKDKIKTKLHMGKKDAS